MARGADLPMRGVAQPAASEVLACSQLHVSSHPVVAHKLARLRQVSTSPQQFTDLVTELSWLLGYEAMQDLQLQPTSVQTPLETTRASELAEKIGFVPILRAGIGMVAGFRQLMPEAQVWHLGLYRNESTLQPVHYYNRLPEKATVQICFVLDPMLATGGSAMSAIKILKDWGAGRIKYIGLIASPYGVKQMVDHFPDVDIHVAAIDRELDARGYILPGLGDAGDRQFGTA